MKNNSNKPGRSLADIHEDMAKIKAALERPDLTDAVRAELRDEGHSLVMEELWTD